MLAYHRPTTLEEALALLDSDDRIVLAGGTVVNAGRRREHVELVDIQSLDLEGVTTQGETLVIGATTTLQQLVDDETMPAILRDLARAELPSTLRSMATVGGTVAAGGADSGLIAGLLVHDAEVTVVSTSITTVVALQDLDPESLDRGLITSIEIAADGEAASSRTGRTPADTPIVSAVGRRGADGAVRMALTGAATRVMLVDASDPAAGLDPAGDFRGSSAYRLRLVEVLTGRVLEELS